MHFLKALVALTFTSIATTAFAAPVRGGPSEISARSPDISKRSPTFRFENCTPEQEKKIRDAYRNAIEVAGRLQEPTNQLQSDQLVYRKIFGDRSVAQALHQDYDSQVQLVRDNLRRVSRLTQDSEVIILWNCDPEGNYKRDKNSKECANTWPEDNGVFRINLFGNPQTPDDGGFLNLPSWDQIMVQITQDPGPSSRTGVCTSLDTLMRTDTAVIFHELLHVTGIGMRADGTRIIDQRLRNDRFAYGEANVVQLAEENPQFAVENADSYAAYLVAVITRHVHFYGEGPLRQYESEIRVAAWEAEQNFANDRPPTPPPGYSPPGYTTPSFDHNPLDNDTNLPPGYGESVDYLFGGLNPYGNLPGWQPPGSSGGSSGGSYFA